MRTNVKIFLLTTLFILMAGLAPDESHSPGGVYGGHYMKWGQPPFVERETIPPPGGAFEGLPLPE